MLDYLSKIQQSYSVAFADFVRNRELAGKQIVKMQTGDPDFNTHPFVVAGAQQALLDGQTKYCDSRGLVALREALVEKLSKQNNIFVSAKENILVTHGAVHGIGMAIKALVNAGDECIILEPFWRSYEANVILAGGVPVIVKADPSKGFQLDAEEVLKHISPKTKLVIVNSPNNPSGAVYHADELKKLATGTASKEIYIISDEVYEDIVFGDNIHYSMASDPAVSKWIISIFSFSKTYAMTGWRIGYMVASKTVVDEIIKLSQFSITSLAPFNQLGALAALKNSEVHAYVEIMRAEYEKRQRLIKEKISGTWLEKACTIPQGTFYVLINMAKFGLPSLELAKRIVDFASVSFTPGIAFGDSMDNYLRMCFATSEQNITNAIQALLDYEKQV